MQWAVNDIQETDYEAFMELEVEFMRYHARQDTTLDCRFQNKRKEPLLNILNGREITCTIKLM